MDDGSQRVNNWLQNFYKYVSKNNEDLLPLYGQRIHFFPRQDNDNTIDVGLDDLHEPYADADTTNKMRSLFEAFALTNKV
jgi:hypothetical protein